MSKTRATLVLCLVCASPACGKKEDLPPAPALSPARLPKAPPVACTADPAFPADFPVPEASGAAEIELRPGQHDLLVISDSSQHGAIALWRIDILDGPPNSPPRTAILPLDPGASDDLEGVAWRDHQLYVLTSSGAVRRFAPDSHGALVRNQDAYRIGPPPSSCRRLTDINCGPNYEGLCLRSPRATARCAGYAASKDQSTLVCVVLENDHLRVDPIKPPLHLRLPARSLSDCAFGHADGPAADTLVVTTNVHDGSTTYRVDETTGELTPLDIGGTPSNEAVAIDHTGALYVFMDANSMTSLGLRFECTGWKSRSAP